MKIETLSFKIFHEIEKKWDLKNEEKRWAARWLVGGMMRHVTPTNERFAKRAHKIWWAKILSAFLSANRELNEQLIGRAELSEPEAKEDQNHKVAQSSKYLLPWKINYAFWKLEI